MLGVLHRVGLASLTIHFYLFSIAPLSTILLGRTHEDRLDTISDILEPLSDPGANTHLLLTLLDGVLIALMPELGEKAQATYE